MHSVNEDTLQKILEQLDSFMGFMGFGREYEKIVKIILELSKDPSIDFSNYHNIQYELRRRK